MTYSGIFQGWLTQRIRDLNQFQECLNCQKPCSINIRQLIIGLSALLTECRGLTCTIMRINYTNLWKSDGGYGHPMRKYANYMISKRTPIDAANFGVAKRIWSTATTRQACQPNELWKLEDLQLEIIIVTQKKIEKSCVIIFAGWWFNMCVSWLLHSQEQF
jgi:hypothetical protein